MALVALLAAAKLGGAAAERVGQPAVLGELLAGIALAALPLAGVHGLDFVAHDPTIEVLAQLGVVLLLFEVGLSTRLANLMRVGLSAFLVATIDDVMGLLVLAVIVGMVGGGGASGTGLQIAVVTLKAIGFLVGALISGRMLAPRLFRLAARLRGRGVVFTSALITCFVLAWAADLAGLAPIVGAFAAGLVLEGVPFGELLPDGESIEHLLLPLSSVLVPIFFVHMGLMVNLRELAGGSVLLALALTAVAILGKQACALAVVTPGADRVAVGLGMIPRGEVGLIFAGMGLTLRVNGVPVLGPGEFAAVVAMVMLTTVLTPPLLRWRLGQEP